MRFKKGNKIEVFSKSEVPSGAWRQADIISGNGHNYTVRYAHYPGMKNPMVVKRVSRKEIRPCPPPVDCVGGWVAGDLVEVFDDFSWKIATILKAFSGECFLVRLLGSSKEFQAQKVNIRVRQSWQDDKWIVIGKVSGSCDVRSNRISTLKWQIQRNFLSEQADTDFEVNARCSCLGIENTTDFQESHVVSARTLKRASPFAGAYAGNIQKTRAIEKEGELKRQQVISGNPSSLIKKVDAVAYPRENLGETYMHASSNNKKNGYNEIERGKQNFVFECSHGRDSDANDSDADICSVGSCSVISNGTLKLSSRIIAGRFEDADTLSSDAESFSDRGDEDEKIPLPLGEDLAARIHSLELHAYRCTLEALYASGPLSWEQEALLTNLRITLHISNDEHLKELRHLISAGTSLYYSE